MAHPTSFRPEPKLGKRLNAVAKESGFSRTDLLEIALTKFFAANPTTNAVIDAVAAYRKGLAK